MSRGSVQRFSSVIEEAERRGAFVSVPLDAEMVYGRKRVPVRVAVDGEPYRGLLARTGGPSHVLAVPKRVCERIGKGPGDSVDVAVEEDPAPRAVPVPRDLVRALKGRPQARRFFRGLPRAGRRRYIRWIRAAERGEARARRVARAVAMLGRGRRAP
jgi:hypothetical protein